MWDVSKQARLDALRRRGEQGPLDTDEERELARLHAELDAQEAEQLRPAMARMDQEIADSRERNAQLAALVAKRHRLLARMRSQLAKWLDEHERLELEAGSLTGAWRR